VIKRKVIWTEFFKVKDLVISERTGTNANETKGTPLYEKSALFYLELKVRSQ
jgi:hypothetical protein